MSFFINQKRFLLFFIFFTPIIPMSISFYINETFPLITFQRVAILILLFFLFFSSLTAKKIILPSHSILFISFLFFAFISSIFSTYPGQSLKEFFSERVIGMFLIYFLVFNLVKDERFIEKSIDVILISGFIIAIFSIFEFLLKTNLFWNIKLIPEEKLYEVGFRGYHQIRAGMLRAQASFPHSIYLGSYLAFLFPICIAKNFNSKRKILWIIILLFYFVSIIMTGSRGALYSLFIIVMFTFWYKKKGIIFTIFSLVLIITVIIFLSREMRAIDYIYRVWLLKGSFYSFLDRPFLGSGFGSFAETVIVLDNVGRVIVTDPLTYFPKMLVENGAITFIFFVLLLYQILMKIKVGAKNYILLNEKKYACIMHFTCFGSILALLTSIYSQGVLNNSNTSIIFWAILALMMRLWLISKERINDEKGV